MCEGGTLHVHNAPGLDQAANICLRVFKFFWVILGLSYALTVILAGYEDSDNFLLFPAYIWLDNSCQFK